MREISSKELSEKLWPIETVNVFPKLSKMLEGETQMFSSTCFDSQKRQKDIEIKKWSCTKGTVNELGEYRALDPGEVKIFCQVHAMVDGKKALVTGEHMFVVEENPQRELTAEERKALELFHASDSEKDKKNTLGELSNPLTNKTSYVSASLIGTIILATHAFTEGDWLKALIYLFLALVLFLARTDMPPGKLTQVIENSSKTVKDVTEKVKRSMGG